MPVPIPPEFLTYAARSESWAVWLNALPRLMGDVVAEWGLRVDGAATHGEAAVVIPVTTTDGEPAVVKFGYPHVEAEHEHLALRAWGGDGAILLLRADPRRSVLLLERATTHDLTSIPVLEACEVIAGLYQRLHLAATPRLRLLSELAGQWCKRLSDLPTYGLVPRRYVDQAASLCRDFASDPATDGRLVHTDLHYFNVLAAEREPWLVIDPKPLSGDPHHEVAPLLWNRWDEAVESGDVRRAVRERFHTVVDTAMLDESRARSWVVVREMVNVLWTYEDLQREGVGAADLGPEETDWITRCVTVAKAVQD